MAADGDPALDALMLPFDHGQIAWPADGNVLFLHARDGAALQRHAHAGLTCVQGFKPAADALQRSGHASFDDDAALAARYPLVLLLPPRQRDEARASFARAVALLAPDGVLVASLANDEGAKSAEADLARLVGPLGVTSKHKCRVFWSRPGERRIDTALLAQWATLDAPRPILDARFTSRPGVFAWDRIDPASALLAEHLPTDLAGHGADLGAGWGYLAHEVLTRCAGVEALDLFEADARALQLARANLAAHTSRVALGFHWADVACGLPQTYDFIVSNPPFHALGRDQRPDIGRAFIAVAASALKPGGRLWLVANRHLPYEAELDASFGVVRSVAQYGGFKVIEASRAAWPGRPR